MASTLVLGCTGMTGSYILSTLRTLPPSQVSSIDVLARRSTHAITPSPTEDSKTTPALNPFIDPDTSRWSAHISSLPQAPSIFFSALATTRGAAGGFDKQYALEHDLNIELAKTAKEKGTKTYVLISAANASTSSYFGYTKMKGQIEDDIKALDFEHTIIVRPGLISGQREESRPAEAAIRKVAGFAGMVSGGKLKDFWAQDADVIARAAVSAALKAEKGELKEKVSILGAKEIMTLGKYEWKDGQ